MTRQKKQKRNWLHSQLSNRWAFCWTQVLRNSNILSTYQVTVFLGSACRLLNTPSRNFETRKWMPMGFFPTDKAEIALRARYIVNLSLSPPQRDWLYTLTEEQPSTAELNPPVDVCAVCPWSPRSPWGEDNTRYSSRNTWFLHRLLDNLHAMSLVFVSAEYSSPVSEFVTRVLVFGNTNGRSVD